MLSSYFLHIRRLLLIANREGVAIRSEPCGGEKAMNVKELLGAGLAVLGLGMKSRVMGRSLTELQGSHDGKESLVRRFEKSVLRRFVGEELLVFAAFASAYLLAWAASRFLQ
jgi:hypothetical protein